MFNCCLKIILNTVTDIKIIRYSHKWLHKVNLHPVKTYVFLQCSYTKRQRNHDSYVDELLLLYLEIMHNKDKFK